MVIACLSLNNIQSPYVNYKWHFSSSVFYWSYEKNEAFSFSKGHKPKFNNFEFLKYWLF